MYVLFSQKMKKLGKRKRDRKKRKMNETKTKKEKGEKIYFGDRTDKFKRHIRSLLNRGIKKRKYLKLLTDEESMDKYSEAFTSDTVDPINNYQVYEQLGDVLGNKFITQYSYSRFPALMCPEGVKVVAMLKIKYGAKQSFYSIAERLNFWEYITATTEVRNRRMRPLLEDVFEAFPGS